MATTIESAATARGSATPGSAVTWERPGDERLFWTLDAMHFPAPLRPAAGAIVARMYAGGFNRAAERYALPVRQRMQVINGYLYQAIYPVGAPPEAVLKMMNRVGRVAPGLVNSIQDRAVGAQVKRYQEQLDPVIDRLAAYWQDELLPEVQRYLAAWEGFALADATMSDLLAHLDETLSRVDRLGEIHFRIGLPYLLAQSLFDELYRDLFAGDAFGAFRLLQGFPNKSLDADHALWVLSRRARALPAVRRVLAERPAGEVVAALAAIDDAGARDFLAALRA
ncbi:MAG TPA: hypothetical protein VFL91_28960, partial [Thermomicrobiales bacterium]|nr:hypothetical protein [Thermomicrobiales bacterium]